MYEIIKTVISSGRFELTDMLKKINTQWLEGSIADEHRKELITIAREKANPEDSYAPVRNQIEGLYKNMEEMAREITELKTEVVKLKGEEVQPPEPEEEYPPYKKPSGAHDAYHAGDKIAFEGKWYICIAPEGVAVVWGPAEYPYYWKEVTE